ncbi:MAG: HEAT repeat domain-containing protein [Nodosilinea sp. LVE1205-7]
MAEAVTTEVTASIQGVESADSKAALVQAVARLAALRHPDAIPTLIRVLGYNNPGAAVAAVDGLVALGAGAVDSLLTELDGYNYGARAWAIRALALIGDPRALPVLLEAATADFALSVRRAAARGVGAIEWQLLPVDRVAGAQAEVLQVLLKVIQDPEWVVRYAAVVSLQTLARTTLTHQSTILTTLESLLIEEPTLAVQARAQWALDQLRSQLSP